MNPTTPTSTTQNRGTHLVVEGTNYSGKGVLIDQIVDDLTSRQHEVFVTREPGGTPIGEKFRTALKETPDVTDFTRALGMNASRAELVARVITPKIASGMTVISDRWLDSTDVFQISMGAMSPAEKLVIKSVHSLFPVPALRIFLVPSRELLHSRWNAKRAETDVFEQCPDREREAYLAQYTRRATAGDPVVLIETTLQDQDAFRLLCTTAAYQRIQTLRPHPCLAST